MPLIIICGSPCSGKSTCGQHLKEYFEKKNRNVVLISDESFFQANDRNLVFKDSSKEKEMRGFLKSAVQRNLQSDNLVILDSSNYIKGFRYELYCLAKEHKTTHCVLQCISPRDIALERNAQRDANKRYNEEIFSALILRYEDPLSTNRWDSPLFNAMYDKLDSIADQIGQVLFDGKSVKPNLSTVSAVTSDNNFLQSVDTKTKQTIDQIMKAQGFGQLKEIKIDDSKFKVSLNKKLTIIELNKFKRQFIGYIKSHPVSTDQISSSFVQFLNANCNS